jgi:predicted nucleotide-binding protein (sugar kinase/HSP70/actin superfamily)
LGAYGAALTAHQNYQADSTVATRFSWFDSFDRKVTFSTKKILCSGCENKCAVKRLIFKNGESYFTGNRCDRYFSNGYFAKEYRENLVVTKLKLLFDQKMKPDKDPILTFGIPRVLNMYENFPFWCAFLVECGFKVVLSDVSSLGLCEKGLDTVMSDNICFPAKLVHGHIVNLIEKGVDQIFYPSVVYENQECRDAENSFNCPIVTGYPDVIRSSIDPKGKYGIPLNCLVVSFKDVSLLKKQLYSFAKQFGVSRRRVYKAIDKGITAHKEYKNRLNEMAVNIINKAKKNNRLLIVLAGRPYHIDPLVNHGISELLAGMGADLIPEDVLPNEGKYTLRDSNVLTQWSYTNRLFAAAKYVAKTAHTELVHITSFGCGLDAISADEAKEIITNAGKIYTLIKMDEITNLGAVRIRLRSTLEAIKETKNKRKTKSFMPKKQEKTIIIPWVSPLYSPLIPFLENTFNQRLELLPPQDSVSVDIGLKYVNNDMCYPAVIIIGDIIKALQSGKYDPENTSVMLTQTGGQCRASNYVFLTKKGLIKAGFSNVSVLSLSLDNSISQPELTINKNGFVKRAGMGVIFTDALAGMHFATVAREVNSGESKKVHEKYLSRMGTGIEKANFKYLLNLLREAISEFNGINIKTESVPVIGVVGEIFVKYNSFSNNNIIEWLISQGIEVVIPSFTSFFTQRFINEEFDQTAYLKCSLTDRLYMRTLNKYTQYYLSKVEKVMQDFRHYRKPHDLRTLAEITSKITSLVNKAGEGWLLTAEMIAMLEDGIENIVCLQPFGCLSNHITGNGLERKLKTQYPRFNLLSINMDPGASEVNILNRLHFMVAAAKEDISKLAVNRNIPVDFGAEYYKNKFPKCAGQMPVS